jgi:hypothetical protein
MVNFPKTIKTTVEDLKKKADGSGRFSLVIHAPNGQRLLTFSTFRFKPMAKSNDVRILPPVVWNKGHFASLAKLESEQLEQQIREQVRAQLQQHGN